MIGRITPLIAAVCMSIEVELTGSIQITVRGGDGNPAWLSQEFVVQALTGPAALVADKYKPVEGRLFEVKSGPHAGRLVVVWADNGDPTSFEGWPPGTAMRLELFEVVDRETMTLHPIGLGWATR